MSPEHFNALVERLSERSQKSPALFRMQVLGLALLGYGYLLLLALAGLITGLGVIAICIFKPFLLVKLLKLIWLPIWFCWSVLSSLWVKLELPTGQVLSPAEAPVLFAEIERIRSAMNGPRPHQVLVTQDYNAAVTQIPRLGPFGSLRSYLIVGLPFIATLSPDQFRAVLAHEFGHLCAGDSRITGRLYQARITWARLEEQFSRRGGFFVRGFLKWFAPLFNAFSLVLARSQEYAADAASARVVGVQQAGEALLLSGLGLSFQESEIWTPIWERVAVEEQPTRMPYETLLEAGRGLVQWRETEESLRRALQRQTDWSDTHPALADRLKAIGASPGLTAAAEGPSAAQVFLGELAPRLAGQLDRHWCEAVAGRWREAFRESQARRAELDQLDARAERGPVSKEEAWVRASLTDQLRGPEAAYPLYEAAHLAEPGAPKPAFGLGRLRLRRGDESGLALLDLAMAGDENAIKPGSELAWRFLKDRGRDADAMRYQEAWRERDEIERAAQAERAEFGPRDEYSAAVLTTEVREELLRRLAKLSFVGGAWWVTKQVRHFPERPPILLLVKPRWYVWTRAEPMRAQLQKALDLHDDVTIAIHTSDLAQLSRKVRKLKAARVYPPASRE